MQAALDWIQSRTGKRVVDSKRLLGGLTSDVYAVTLEKGETLVVRCYAEWGKGAADVLKHEAAVLERLSRSAIPAPRLVAAEPSGETPMLLMTRLPGEVWLTPPDFDSWLGQMARMLVEIHAVPLEESEREPKKAKAIKLDVPAWTTRSALWKRTKELLKTPPDAFAPSFAHLDYQHFNMLWQDGRMTGVVDWVYAGRGHPDADAAHCRLNLAILYSTEVAERFREIYEAEQGRAVDPVWDLRGLISYSQDWRHFIPMQVAGRTTVDGPGMDARVEDLMERVVARV
jgi:aminoglycoside phosphotransferase (APT) family kinase protein